MSLSGQEIPSFCHSGKQNVFVPNFPSVQKSQGPHASRAICYVPLLFYKLSEQHLNSEQINKSKTLDDVYDSPAFLSTGYLDP